MAKLRVNKIAAVGVSTETTGSVFFDGTDDFMGLDGSSDFAFGTGDFAIEFWVYFNAGSFSSDSVDPNLIDFRPNNTNGAYPSIQYDTSANNLRYYVNTANRIDGGQLSDQTWYHIALEREGTSTKMYVNGSQVGSTYSDSTDYLVGTNRPVIACQGHNTANNNRRLDGYISNLRICKGHAVYKSNFTPPTKELDVHPQSVLLACYDGENIFADKTGRHIITAYGDRVSGLGTAAQSPIGITTFQPGLIRDVDPTAGPTFQGGVGYNSQNWLTLPKGTTTDRMPVFGGVNATSARGIFAGSRDSPATAKDNIDYITISTLGNATDFGNLTQITREFSACSSSTRGVMGGGFVSPGVESNVMQYLTIATTGNAQDFGDLITATRGTGGASSSTRGLFSGGYAPSNVNTIQFITIQSTGNTQDFGDLTDTFRYHDGMNSTTRAVFAGGGAPDNSATDKIDYVSIPSTGNAVDFGDLLTSGIYANANFSNSTRGIIGSIGSTNTIEFITIATLGSCQNFGDTLAAGDLKQGTCSSTRGVIAGGRTPSQSNTIQYITIATTGDAQEFGDLNFTQDSGAACSNGHGGLG